MKFPEKTPLSSWFNKIRVPYSEFQIKDYQILLPTALDLKAHFPPASHLELHPLDSIIAIAQVGGHLWLGGHPVAVLRHCALDRDRGITDRFSIWRFDMQRPGVQLVERNRCQFAGERSTIESLFRKSRCRIIEFGWCGHEHRHRREK